MKLKNVGEIYGIEKTHTQIVETYKNAGIIKSELKINLAGTDCAEISKP